MTRARTALSASTFASALVLAGMVTLAPGVSAVTAADQPRAEAVTPECTITGTAGKDVLQGTSRADVICGLAGNDTLMGVGGNDTLMGGAGKDKLDAGKGKDDLIGGTGLDQLTTGPGADLCSDDPADTVTDTCDVDTSGPEVSNVDLPASLAAGSTLTITWDVADAAGVTNTNLFIGGQSGFVDWCPFGLAGALISGNDTDGTYTGSCEVPADAVSGQYSVTIGASDVFGNQTSQGGTEFTVTGGSDDSSAPISSDLVFPTSVEPGESIVLQWRATDETGVEYTFPWISGSDGNLIGPDGEFYATPDSNSSELVSGTATDGIYEASVTISDTIPDGFYNVRFTNGDVLDNSTYEVYLDEAGNEVGFTIS